MALAAHIPGAQSIPRHSQAFLGFDTTFWCRIWDRHHRQSGDLPGLTNQWPNGYFKQGTTMHLSHLFEDLATWYEQSFPQYGQRANAMLYPGQSPKPRLARSLSNHQVKLRPRWRRGFSGTTATATLGACRLWTATTSPITSTTAKTTPRGRPFPCAAISTPLDNPFYYTSDPTADHYSKKPAAGLHFVIFQPTSAIFNLVRLSMDGHFPDMTTPVAPHSPHARHHLGPAYDPPAELSGSTTSPSLLPARRVPCLTPPAPLPLHSLIAKAAEEINLASSRRWPVPRMTGWRASSPGTPTGRR